MSQKFGKWIFVVSSLNKMQMQLKETTGVRDP